MPEQHAVLAAAAARKSGKEPATVQATIRNTSANQKGMKTFVFKKLAAEPASPSSSKRGTGAHKLSPAMFSVVRAKYQKGDLKDSFTGAVYFRGKPRYRNNDTFKDKVNAKLLTENVRWNDEFKCYTAKVYTVEGAIMVREV